jgi:hypothetical protein
VALDLRKEQHDRDVTLAWNIAALRGTKGLPPLDKILTRRARRQSPAEQAALWQTIAAKHGGVFKPVTGVTRG